MKQKYSFIVILALPFLILSKPVLANAGWPGLYPSMFAAQATQKFWYLVLTCLIIEGVALWHFLKLSPLKATLLTMGANAASALVGLALPYALLYTDNLWSKAFEFAPDAGYSVMFTFDWLAIFSVSVLIEALIVKYGAKTSFWKAAGIMAIANVVTHILGLVVAFRLI